MFHPRVCPNQAPSEVDVQAAQAALAAMNLGKESREEAKRLRREALRKVEGLRSADAAEECICACHDQMGKLHDQGRTCPCQLSAEERRAAFEEAMEEMTTEWYRPEAVAARAKAEAAFASEAERLGASIESHGGGAPYLIIGSVDGRAFFLRERGDAWHVEIAGDEDPENNPWRAGNQASIVVAEGSTQQLEADEEAGFEITALRIAVEAVRTFLLRRTCEHFGEGAWCPKCGVKRSEADLWRVYTGQ
jgi:hypothetical protein